MSVLRAGRVEVAPGDGLLARRPDAVLFVARPDGSASWAGAIDAFVGAPDVESALAAVLDHAVDHHLEVGPFSAVTWTSAVHLVVFGDLVVATSLPSVPQLTGAGMPTWVEHRATRFGELSDVRLGGPPATGTDLVAGIVPAGGFHVVLHAPSIQPVPTRPAPTPDPGVADDPAPASPRMPAATASVEHDAPPARAAVHSPPVAGQASWDVLRDAGGAWMDDSLQLSEPRLGQPTTTPPPPGPAHPGDVDASELAGGAAGRPGPATRAFDPEVTLDAGAMSVERAARPSDAPPEPGPFARYVQARRCDLGHLNPPLRTSCRVCEHYLPPATPVETVPQPALATLVLGDGRTVGVDGAVVLGRTPSAEAARLDEPATLITVGDATVSRTHAVVTVDGWTLLATDCAATGGTAIAPSGGEPAVLEPWVPHELSIGDTLFLGGPTKVQVVARHE